MTTPNIRVIGPSNERGKVRSGSTKLPKVLKISYRNTLTELLRTEGNEYTGVPETDDTSCRFALIVKFSPNKTGSSGYRATVSGMAAVNFITNGGWKVGDKVPSPPEKEEAMKEFLDLFTTALRHHLNWGGKDAKDNKTDELEKLIVNDVPGVTVKRGVMTAKDASILALSDVKIPCHYLEAARYTGLRIQADIEEEIRRSVSSGYAGCVRGEWDEESDEVAMTSALPHRQAQLMRLGGYKFVMMKHKRIISS
ncbi:MAG: hypothetical protein CL582_22405 [Alteromonadaceae bacterium]|nr:hypothetical protein [Alteromonadaceae bacterium]|tara:strand:- start:180 stop:938 length:759 start_codon:yes stop_codon:yes gene_type:complete